MNITMIKTLIDYIVNLFVGQSYGNDEYAPQPFV